MWRIPICAWSLARLPSLRKTPYFLLLLVNYGCVSKERFVEKHLGVTENILVYCFAFLSCPLACCAALLNTDTNTHYYIFCCLSTCSLKVPFMSLHRTKKETVSKQTMLKVASGFKCFGLPCVLPLNFFLTSLSLCGALQKTVPVEHCRSVHRG